MGGKRYKKVRKILCRCRGKKIVRGLARGVEKRCAIRVALSVHLIASETAHGCLRSHTDLDSAPISGIISTVSLQDAFGGKVAGGWWMQKEFSILQSRFDNSACSNGPGR